MLHDASLLETLAIGLVAAFVGGAVGAWLLFRLIPRLATSGKPAELRRAA